MSWLDLEKGANSMFLKRLGMKVMAKSEWVSGPECFRDSWMVIGLSLALLKIGHPFQEIGCHYRHLEIEGCTLVREGSGQGEEWAFLERQPSAGVQSKTRRNRSTLAKTGPPVVRSVSGG
jgi:hypothetical protein